MRYFYSKNIDTENGTIVIDGEEYRHVIKVNRLREGDTCIIINGEGLRAQVTLDRITKKDVTCRIEQYEVHERPIEPRITLCCAISRKGVFATVVEKAVELGVDVIVPFISGRSMVKIHDDESFVAKHTLIVREALKQCHRLFEPCVHVPIRDVDAIPCGRVPGGIVKRFLLEPTNGMMPRDAVAMSSAGNVNEIFFAVGPEGGFSSEEQQCFARNGFENVYFPHTIMRTDTAVVAMLSVLRFGR
ncbi:MAG: 16S rRNA (uracil(1498)-N(3))-methyltransferase [Candidatus Omnitrophica bacterium]|nr:16S rRNA (uracil(1498)-N(3))-methyltransferase [Candidatus Omnitrophota bacterium]